MAFTRGLFVIVLLSVGTFVSAQTDHPELDLGLARYVQDTGNNALALRYTRNPQTEEAYLVRAKALLETGGESQASAFLDQLLEGDYYRGEAALLKAGLPGISQSEQKRLLELAAKKAHGEEKQQALYELAERARTSDRPDKAGQMLATMNPGYWAALGYMNIAADYGKRDLNPSRALIALRVAMAMADEDLKPARGEALKAQLLVRAGLLAYQHEDYDKAISFLEKVSLDSYSTPRALYLHGLALSGKGNHRDAMQSWHRAKKYPLAFPGVAESWLGTGRGYDLAGYLGQAGEAFLSASATYKSEQVTLRKLVELVREKGAYEALVVDAGERRAEWFLADSRVLTQPRSAYLLRFMEQPDAQDAVERVRELQAMLARTDQQQHTLAVFEGVLEERLAEKSAASQTVTSELQEQVEYVRARMAAIQPQAAPGSNQERELKQLAMTLADVKNSASQFRTRMERRDQRLRGLSDTVSRSMDTLDRNRKRATEALSRANAQLDERVLAYVDQERQRMLASLEKAEQQIAHLYEYLALQTLDGSSP